MLSVMFPTMTITAAIRIDESKFRPPEIEDGPALYQLARAAGTLDVNSEYAYLLPGLHHAETSVLATQGGAHAGFVSGYIIPSTSFWNNDRAGSRLFIWQVGVHPDFRGQGLARAMLLSLLERPANHHISHIETTITPSNTASQKLFESVARSLGCPMKPVSTLGSHLFIHSHEAETVFRIGPFKL